MYAPFFTDATQYAHYVFNTLTKNSSGQISFEVSRFFVYLFFCFPETNNFIPNNIHMSAKQQLPNHFLVMFLQPCAVVQTNFSVR